MSHWDAKQLQLKLTCDGSFTIFVPGLNEHYHSVYGAVTESLHIFIGAGFNFVKAGKSRIDILEVGLGTGLNAFLTWQEVLGTKCRVNYCSVEPNPLPPEICKNLNYAEIINAPGSGMDFLQIHDSPWNQINDLDDNFTLRKIHDSIQDFHPEAEFFDLIYFDAFGPDVQPEMWTTGVFDSIYRALKPGGALVTYSTKGQVKRNLKATGFMIEKLPGPPGKREILRALKR